MISFLEGTKEIVTPARSNVQNQSNTEGDLLLNEPEPNPNTGNLFELEHQRMMEESSES